MSDMDHQGLGRRGALRCMAAAGAGFVWTLSGGVLRGAAAGSAEAAEMAKTGLTFAQISDTHFGFNKDANPDVAGTASAAIDAINSMGTAPAFILHTGDISHLSKPAEFDAARAAFSRFSLKDMFFTPGEHDVLDATPGQMYREQFAKGSKGNGWYSFDISGVHFVSLVNVLDFGTTGLGKLGDDQIEWLEDDLKAHSDSTPIVVFTHIPLWSVYPQWGWGTGDAERAMAYLRRFGSVTVLSGHIHQVIQKVEGNITFLSANSTAYPQPAPGEAPSPGPLKVPADRLRSVLGVRQMTVVSGHPALITNQTLAGA